MNSGRGQWISLVMPTSSRKDTTPIADERRRMAGNNVPVRTSGRIGLNAGTRSASTGDRHTAHRTMRNPA
jgi:hypothetical protein